MAPDNLKKGVWHTGEQNWAASTKEGGEALQGRSWRSAELKACPRPPAQTKGVGHTGCWTGSLYLAFFPSWPPDWGLFGHYTGLAIFGTLGTPRWCPQGNGIWQGPCGSCCRSTSRVCFTQPALPQPPREMHGCGDVVGSPAQLEGGQYLWISGGGILRKHRGVNTPKVFPSS